MKNVAIIIVFILSIGIATSSKVITYDLMDPWTDLSPSCSGRPFPTCTSDYALISKDVDGLFMRITRTDKCPSCRLVVNQFINNSLVPIKACYDFTVNTSPGGSYYGAGISFTGGPFYDGAGNGTTIWLGKDPYRYSARTCNQPIDGMRLMETINHERFCNVPNQSPLWTNQYYDVNICFTADTVTLKRCRNNLCDPETSMTNTLGILVAEEIGFWMCGWWTGHEFRVSRMIATITYEDSALPPDPPLIYPSDPNFSVVSSGYLILIENTDSIPIQ